MAERAEPRPLPVEARRDGGRYTLLSLLGRGGMGEVYLAQDERLRRRVAIKRIRAAGHNEVHLHARLEQEARVLAQLGHPAIVAVFDIFEDADGTWVVMELIVGRTLAKVLEPRPLAVDDVLARAHYDRALELLDADLGREPHDPTLLQPAGAVPRQAR